MMWPFRKKEQPAPKATAHPTLKLKGEKSIQVPRGHIIAKGGEIRMAVTLKEKLIANRMHQAKGSGEAYWDSVVEVVERHYGKAS